MHWIQAKDALPPLGKSVIVAKKSIYERPGQVNKCTFFTCQLLHPHSKMPEFDKNLYFWGKADLHKEEKIGFNIKNYLEEKSQCHLGEQEKLYFKLTPLDWWMELNDPDSKIDFDIA